MFSKSTRVNAFLSFLFLLVAGCGDFGAGCGCSVQPLPGGALPADQTVEGGGQIRVTQAGFQKINGIVSAVLNDVIGEGFCVPNGSTGYTLGTGADYCMSNPAGGACGNSRGCDVNVAIDQLTVTPINGSDQVNIQVQIDASSIVRVEYRIVGIGGSCNLGVDAQNLFVDVDIQFGIDPATGELTLELASVNNTDFSGVDFDDCGILDEIADLAVDILDSFIGEFIIDLLTPTLDGLIQGFLPDPLGIEGLVDVGGLVGGVSPGTEATMEARMVPGGYVDVNGGGLSLGLITGLNADEDIATRTPDLDSEPHLCVPPIAAPNFAAPPASLPATTRGTFALQAAGAFLGAPEPADDLAIGISETTLDLAGHHAVTSGAMCLGVGTSLVAQLNLGTFSLLVPSLANLGDGTNPVLLVTRPQRALDFTVGDGTTESPAISIAINDFEVDIYVFVYERYTRAFTMNLDLTVGVNLTFDQQPGMPATVTPELVGLDSDNITVTVHNNEFVAESAQQLEGVLPTIFDLAVGLLGDGLGAIDVPEFAGLTLNNLRVQKVTTSEDDFMAIYASLGTSPMLRELGDRYPSVRSLIETPAYATPEVLKTAAPAVRVVEVATPAVSEVRLALQGHPDAHLPAVTLALPEHDAAGRPLEHAWSLGERGAWRPFRAATKGVYVISDRAFAWQGKYDLRVRSRVVGDYTTTSEPVTVPVIVDSVAPELLADQATYERDVLRVPARDLVSPPSALEYAFGHPGDDRPWTDWKRDATLPRAVVEDLAAGGEIAVFVRDEAGNVRSGNVPVPFHGAPGEAGCSCDAGGGAPTTGSLLLMLATAGLLARRRVGAVARAAARSPKVRRWAGIATFWGGVLVVSSLVPACSCGSDPGVMACEVTEDCTIECPNGELPFCLDNTCVCIDDVPYGRIGPFSDVAVASTGDAWVSAYAESHGDLVVATWDSAGRIVESAWEFVDGVPDGPVAIPQSEVRGGILEEGPDVGMYTSIAVAPDDTPMVTYHDRDTGSLKFAARYGGTWQIHTIDDGTGDIDPELGGENAGLYSAISLRTDNGNPGVAYMAQVSSGAGVVTTEVRFAAAQSATPSSAGDWVFFVVDTLTLPPADEENPDVTPIPQGLGLFIEASRAPDQAPVLVYYDRSNGDLKLARLDAQTGAFVVEILDGAASDVGWYPSVAVDAEGVAHVSYQSATRDDLLYVNSADRTPAIVDDGYRVVGTTEDGLPKPEYHFVGQDSNLLLAPTGPVVVYQDSTTHELLYAAYNSANGLWQRRAIAGDEAEFVGAYGFFASAVLAGDDIVVSNWVIDQAHSDQWVEIHRERVVVE